VKIVYQLLAIIGIIFLSVWLSVVLYAYKTTIHKADVAIVLGAAIWTDRPSPVFRERINHSIKLYKNSQIKYIIFTGGLSDGDKYAESEVGKKIAISQGVPKECIFIEKKSTKTIENLIEAKKIINEKHLKKALLVSDPIHMKRATYMAKSIGMDIKSSPTTTSKFKTLSSKFKFSITETVYLIKYIFYEFGL